MYAPPKTDKYKVLNDPDILKDYDAFLFGIPTRYGNFPAQWKTFIDSTGGLWQAGGLWAKYVGIFVSTGGPGGGQESTFLAAMSTIAHHGLIFIPLGFKPAMSILSDMSELRGGSPWGAGTFSVSALRLSRCEARKKLTRSHRVLMAVANHPRRSSSSRAFKARASTTRSKRSTVSTLHLHPPQV